VDLAEMVTRTARSVVPEGISLTLDVNEDIPLVRGHHDALSRALGNVLLNAVEALGPSTSADRYDSASSTATAGAVVVRVRRTPADENDVEIVVEDNGPGIAAEKLAGIWDPYVTHKPGGTGLGLAITRQTVESHGGIVTASSSPGNGTVIKLILPLDGVSIPTPGSNAAQPLHRN